MRRRYFGTDGVRGIANQELTAELALKLAQGAVLILREQRGGKLRFLIGKDTRLSCGMLEAATVAGLTSAGADAILIGAVPSPAVAYLVKGEGMDGGVMISASHNPFNFNGIKFFGSDGDKLTDEQEAEIERVMESDYSSSLPLAGDLGRREEGSPLVEKYEARLASLATTGLEGMRLAMDCANGSFYEIAPQVLRRLGAEVITSFCEPDGININEGCGAVHPEAVAKVVKESGAQLGISFDGDGDRVLMIDENGELVDGDQILAICARELKAQGLLPNNLVVGTLMTNLGLEQALTPLGCQLLRTKVGDRYVLQAMRERGAVLGGETSGHIIFLDHATTGDGLLTAIKVLGIMVQRGKSLSELAEAMVRRPQVTINVEVARRGIEWEGDSAIQEAIKKAEKTLGENGRILVRASGTEPVIRVMAEASTEEEARAQAKKIAEVVEKRLASTS